MALPMIIISFVCDSWYYGKWTSPAYNFLEFNVLSGGSDYFDTNSKLNYILLYPVSQMSVLYPLLCYGLWKNLESHYKNKSFPLIGSLLLSYLIALTLIGHKEMRFTLPIYSIMCMFVATGIVKWVSPSGSTDIPSRSQKRTSSAIVKIAL